MPVLVFRYLEVEDDAQEHTGNLQVEGDPVKKRKIISERIVNVGSGAAMDIRLKSNGSFENGEFRFQKGHALDPWPLPVDNVIGPDNGNPNLQVCYLRNEGNVSILKNSATELLLTYKDVFGRECETIFECCGNIFVPPKGEPLKALGSLWKRRTHRIPFEIPSSPPSG